MRGMELMNKRKWKQAEAEFQQAVAEDPSSVKAHYNLASAASRAEDLETAIWELMWVGDHAEAKLIDLEQGQSKDERASTLPEAERTKMAAVLTAAPGEHDAKCAASDPKQGKVFALALQAESMHELRGDTALASLKDGVAIVNAKGAIIARGAPLGCTGPGASQDQIGTFVWLWAVPDSPGSIIEHHSPPTDGLRMFAVSYTTGGRRDWQTNLAVFVLRDKTLVKVFEGLIASSDATGAGHVWQSPLGNLVYSGPGEKKKHGFSWDQTAFKFVAMP